MKRDMLLMKEWEYKRGRLRDAVPPLLYHSVDVNWGNVRQAIFFLQKGKEGQLVEMIRIFIVDDQPAVRRGLRMRLELEPDLLVLGEAGDGESALPLIGAFKPDVVLMDLAMPHLDGIAAAEALRTSAPESAIVILSLHSDPATRARAHAAGAAAFVEKQAGEGALLSVIRSVPGQHRDGF